MLVCVMVELPLTTEDQKYLNFLIYSLKMGLVRVIESNPNSRIVLQKQGFKVYSKYQGRLCYLSKPLVSGFYREALRGFSDGTLKKVITSKILGKQDLTLPKDLITGWGSDTTLFSPQKGVKLKIKGTHLEDITLHKRDSNWYLVC